MINPWDPIARIVIIVLFSQCSFVGGNLSSVNKKKESTYYVLSHSPLIEPENDDFQFSIRPEPIIKRDAHFYSCVFVHKCNDNWLYLCIGTYIDTHTLRLIDMGTHKRFEYSHNIAYNITL